MKPVAVWLLLLLCVPAIRSQAQAAIRLPQEKPVYLPDSLNEPKYEFSGLARWRDKILLVPQHVQASDKYHIVAIDTAAVDSVISGKTLFVRKSDKIRFGKSLDTVYASIKRSILPRTDFGGFEAAVVVGDDIFLTVETDSLCYVVKGTIEAGGGLIAFRPSDTLSLPKPGYTFGNAGFESIAYLPGQQRLIAFYENNAATGITAYTFTTALQDRQPARFARPMLFRLTDVSYSGHNTLIGINHYYRDYNDTVVCGIIPRGSTTLRNEYCYYVAEHPDQARAEMHEDPKQTSFTRLVQLTWNNGVIQWAEKKILSYSTDNWEGILPYKKGVLMVVDGRPPGVPCKLAYIALP